MAANLLRLPAGSSARSPPSQTYGSRNPRVRRYRRARGFPDAHRPDKEMLTGAVARQAAQLALPAPAPSAMLIGLVREHVLPLGAGDVAPGDRPRMTRRHGAAGV